MRFEVGGGAAAEGPEQFHFFLPMSEEREDWVPGVTRVLVVRDGDQIALLCTSPAGLPYAYMTEGLLLFVDRANAGGLVACPRGAPSFVLTV